MKEEVRTSDQPMDRLTELCAQMTAVLDTPENSDVRALVFLSDSKHGGIVAHGYEDQSEAMAELFVHMQAVFRSVGKDLQFIAVPQSPEGLT